MLVELESLCGRLSHGKQHTGTQARWCRDSSLRGEEGRTKGAMVKVPGPGRIHRRFASTKSPEINGYCPAWKWGEGVLERGRYASQNSETRPACLGLKLSLLPSAGSWLNGVLDTYLHAYRLVFKVWLSGFNPIFKALGHLYPDDFGDVFFTLVPTLPSDTASLSPLIPPEPAWQQRTFFLSCPSSFPFP